MMAHTQEVRDKVYRLYVFEQRPLEQAATSAGIPFSTARRWRESDRQKGKDWDKVRAANLMAGGGLEDVGREILTGFLVQYKSVIEELTHAEGISHTQKANMLASLADAFNKTVAASRKVLPETSELATAMEVLNFMAIFIQEKYPQHLSAFLEILEPFGQEINKKYG